MCSTTMQRVENTGIAAYIYRDGVIRSQAVGLKTGQPKQDEAVVDDTVPLDSRRSLYLAGGDWFGGMCLVCCCVLSVAGVFGRWLPGRAATRSDTVRVQSAQNR